MKSKLAKLTLCALAALGLLCLATPARAIDYSNFPPELQLILDDRRFSTRVNNGFCFAGRVTFEDGAVITNGGDVMVNFINSVDIPLQVYSNGWFIAKAFVPDNYRTNGHLVLRAFAYEPLDYPTNAAARQITYVSLTMKRLPASKLGAIKGKIANEQGSPIGGVKVSVHFNLAYSDEAPAKIITTDADGKFSFTGLCPTNYWMIASHKGTAGHSSGFSAPPGGVLETNLTLYPVRAITFDYVCQPNKSRDFTAGNPVWGSRTWTAGSGPMNFVDQVIGWKNSPDLNLEQLGNQLSFRSPYIGPKTNGFYDAGVVPFTSVTNAAATGYDTRRVPCQVGHVYVVKTMNGFYAKLVVKTD